MDRKTSFKYKADTLSELLEVNRFLTEKISLFHREPKNFPTVVKYLHEYEKEISIKAIQDKITNLKEDDVEYYINSLGYREKKSEQQMYNSVGVWGCSYTFGVGMPVENIYSTLLEEKLNMPVYNFGIPGAGIQKITRSFIVNNNFFKFKTAFFVLPSMYRFDLLSFNSYDNPKSRPSDQVHTIDLIPNWIPKHNRELIKKIESFYEIHDDAFFLMEFSRSLELIKQNAEINGTKVYFSTWCGDSQKLFSRYNIPISQLIRFVESEEATTTNIPKNFARDGIHPAFESHKATADTLYNLFINNITKPVNTTKFI